MSDTVSLGIDVGGGAVKAVVLGSTGVSSRFIDERKRALVPELTRLVDRIAEDHAIGFVGIGIAGLVDHRSGTFVWGPHVPGGPVDVAGALPGRRVYVDNDANLAAYGEATVGAAKGHPVVLTVSVGTGIGSGIVVDGEIQRGVAFAGEVGHMKMASDGEPCPCGRSGCWETLVSGRTLDAEARRLGVGPDAASLVVAADDGDDRAAASLDEAGRWLGVGIANLVLAFDPSVVVVAGGVSMAGERILAPAREWIASALPGAAHRPVIEVAASPHGRWSAAVGAAHAARDHFEGPRTNEEGA